MDVKINPKNDTSQVEIKIKADAAEFKPYLERAARDLTKAKALSGFRPGKAPLSAVIEKFGTERVIQAAVEKAVPRLFVEAILANDIEALGRPKTSIEDADLTSGLSFNAVVDILPKINLGDPKNISLIRRSTKIDRDRIDAELKYLAKSRSTYLDVTRPAKNGDTVTVDFNVLMDGKPMEGGSSKNHPVHIGEGHFIPDFENKIVGIQTGDNREFAMNFPEDYAHKDLRGKSATAKVKAHNVQRRIIPEINDAFAKSLGEFKSLQDLKDKLWDNLQQELVHKEEDRLKGELADKLAEISTFSALPSSLIEKEIDRRLAELSQMLKMQQKSLDEYLKIQQKTLEEIRGELRGPAEKTVKVSLALREFAKQESIDVADEEIEAKMQEFLQLYEKPADNSRKYNRDNLRNSITSTLRNQKTLDRLEELAQISDAIEDSET